MKLIYQITIRLSVVLLVLLAVWGVLFYVAMLDEVNDEIDETLEEYAAQLIARSLAGVEMPTEPDGTNNTYRVRQVSRNYARENKGINHWDMMVSVPGTYEEEPARVLTTIYKDNEGQYYELMVMTPSIEKQDLMQAILSWGICLYIGLLLTIILVHLWIYYGSMKPLHTLLRWFDDYTVGSRKEPLKNETKVVEFRKLNEAVLRSTERSEQLFEQQKQFIGNASHELQTPLAICQNRLEMLLDSDLSEEQMGEILKTIQTLKQIARLNQSLLFLSKIDNRQFPECSDINFNTLVKSQLPDYAEAYAYKNISQTLTEPGNLVISMNESLAQALVVNLLKNAYVHTQVGGQIEIEIRNTCLKIKNSGLQPLDKRVFERFYQGTRQKGSTGLGLAIVDAICKMYNMTISYFFDNGMHVFLLQKIS